MCLNNANFQMLDFKNAQITNDTGHNLKMLDLKKPTAHKEKVLQIKKMQNKTHTSFKYVLFY